ncbi:MAG TPA: hypothetical protein VIC57_07050, partial [Candidatus Dormibacteraeota bacterium]
LVDGAGRRLAEILETELTDDRLAWTLEASGAWSRPPAEWHLDAQERFRDLAHERARTHGPDGTDHLGAPASLAGAFVVDASGSRH